MTSTGTALSLSLLAAVPLFVALGAGIYLDRDPVFLWNRPTCYSGPNYRLVNLEAYLDRRTWNQLLAGAGLLCGTLVIVALLAHDRYLAAVRRWRELRHEPDLPLLLRPFGHDPGPKSSGGCEKTTTKTTTADFAIGLRSLAGVVIASLLASTAAVSAFGVHLTTWATGGPLPQVPTSNLTRLRITDGYLSAGMLGEDLVPILYRSAFRRASIRTRADMHDDAASYWNTLPSRAGALMYPGLRTHGVGFPPVFISAGRMAPGWRVNSARAVVVGTNATATCRDATADWNWTHEEIAAVGETAAGWQPPSYVRRFKLEQKEGYPPFPLGRMVVLHRDPTSVQVGLWQRGGWYAPNGKLLHTFVVTKLRHLRVAEAEHAFVKVPEVTVVECTYAGHDIRRSISVPVSGAPPHELLVFDKELEVLDVLGQLPHEPLFHALQTIGLHIGQTPFEAEVSTGGVLLDGMTHAGIQETVERGIGIDFPALLEDILTDTVQAYFSLYRQMSSFGTSRNQHRPAGEEEGETNLQVLRVGDGERAWLGVIAALAVVMAIALVRTAWVGVQEAVASVRRKEALPSVNDVPALIRVAWGGGLGVVAAVKGLFSEAETAYDRAESATHLLSDWEAEALEHCVPIFDEKRSARHPAAEQAPGAEGVDC